MYKAYIKNGTEQNNLYTFGKKCILLISVGQQYHEGDKLLSAVDLINRAQFEECNIVVADSLQKYNFIDYDDAAAYIKAIALGDEWLKRNKLILNNFKISSRLTRWDFWLNCKKFIYFKALLKKRYAFDVKYKEAIDNTINKFIERYIVRHHQISTTNFFNNCLEYLLEECAIIMCLWAEEGYDYILYPQPMTNAMNLTYELFVKSNYPNKVQWLSLRFKQKKNIINGAVNFLYL